MDFATLLQFIQAGGNTALLAACYFIWRASNRLSRIEAMLELVLKLRGVSTYDIEGSDG
jgi:hypothetical protein